MEKTCWLLSLCYLICQNLQAHGSTLFFAWIKLIKVWSSFIQELKLTLSQIFLLIPLNVSLTFLTLSLVIGSSDTSNYQCQDYMNRMCPSFIPSNLSLIFFLVFLNHFLCFFSSKWRYDLVFNWRVNLIWSCRFVWIELAIMFRFI